MVYNSVIEAIGNTPIVRLNRVAESVNANVYAKLEFTNPGGSIKDRIGFWMIEDAERKGTLKPGGTNATGATRRRSRDTSAYSSCRTRCPRKRSRTCALSAPRWW